MVFAYYNRLSAERKRIYRASDVIEALAIPAGFRAGALVARLEQELLQEHQAQVRIVCQTLVDELARGFKVPPIRVSVLATRPSNATSELHGLYEPEDGKTAHISVWMRTAQRKQVVAFKTFLRTLIHELCHHLDYELFQFPETFHTEGFYKRESSLVNALLAQAAEARASDAGEGAV